MTLQKQSLFVLPLLMTTSITSWPPSVAADNNIKFYKPAVFIGDTTVPYLPQLVSVYDSMQKIPATDLPAKPQMRMHSSVVKFVGTFLKKNSKDLEEVAIRGQKLFPVMENIFKSYGLPKELKYLAVVESDLKMNARSHAGAVGYWQFMRQTAVELGLKINGKTDERKHLRKSTAAAAKYLKALYKTYSDWLLVIAAYNSGPGVVNTAIKKSGSRDFWKLQQYLSAETRGHVKRYIAIHSFFEEAGSETTLTKKEYVAYTRELEHYNRTIEKLPTSADSISVTRSNKMLIVETNYR